MKGVATMRLIAAVCALLLVKVTSTKKVGTASNGCDETNRSMFFEVVGGANGNHAMASGSPISLRVRGVADSSASVVDVDDVQIRVQIKTVLRMPQSESKVVELEEFEFDLCTDVVGVKCPLPVGTAFEGIATWNAVEVPADARYAEETAKVVVRIPTVPHCFMSQILHITVGKPASMLGWENMSAISHHLVKSINARDSSWKAVYPSRFDGHTIVDARRVAGGTVMRGQLDYDELPRRKYRAAPLIDTEALAMTERRLGARGKAKGKVKSKARDTGNGEIILVDSAEEIPDTFDVREAFPECASIVGRIRDQSDCGSCWAFASTEAFNDRRCIAGAKEGRSRGVEEVTANQLVMLSAEDTTACCWGLSCGLSMGCNGGQPGSAWRWFTNEGVVTGGDYNDIGQGTTCKPYEFKPCAHHVDPSVSGYPACPDGEYPTPECLSYCSEPSYTGRYGTDKKMAKKAYSLRGVEDIQRDMMRYGSVTASFSVYSDFLAYSGGVYRNLEGMYSGGHAVKIIGWGTDADSGEDYWLVANSWNDSWGESGYFRILRGVNECGIEGSIVAGEAGEL